MHDDSGRRGRRTIQDQRTSLEQQVVLGHLLPHYQAALGWQDTVRTQRLLQSVSADGMLPRTPGMVSLLHDAVRWWRSRHGFSSRGSRGECAATMTDRLSSAETLETLTQAGL
jgi:hypothetical protein